jgi:hypothetical protein
MPGPSATPCPDCPAARNGVLERLLGGGETRCAFRCLFVAARQPLSPLWFGRYGLALVRRGVVVRQRMDSHGAPVAIDAVGPGGAMPLFERDGAASSGYAAADVLVCVCPRRSLQAAIDAGAPSSAQIVGLHLAALDRVERIASARCHTTAVARVATLLCALADTPCRLLAA